MEKRGRKGKREERKKSVVSVKGGETEREHFNPMARESEGGGREDKREKKRLHPQHVAKCGLHIYLLYTG